MHNWIENWLNNRKQTDWPQIASGVSQGSVLRSVVFAMYINDINVGFNNFIANFADSTKIRNSVISNSDRQSLQEDLNKFSAWSDRCKMPFNVNRCHIFQVGTRNQKYEYEMGRVKLGSVQCVKDIDVTIALNLKFSQHYKNAEGKANRTLSFRNIFFPSTIKI